MIVSIKINAQMDCNYICQQLQRAIISYQKEHNDLTDCVMVIDIKKPYDDDSFILKLEHKNIST